MAENEAAYWDQSKNREDKGTGRGMDMKRIISQCKHSPLLPKSACCLVMSCCFNINHPFSSPARVSMKNHAKSWTGKESLNISFEDRSRILDDSCTVDGGLGILLVGDKILIPV